MMRQRPKVHTASRDKSVGPAESVFFVILLPPLETLGVMAAPAVSEKQRALSMTSEVMGGQRASQMFPWLMRVPRDYWSVVSAARVASSAGKKLSMRISCRATSCGVPKVVRVENKRSVALFHL
jgi:hypothetical protein